jgi:hypothetical protein
VCYFPGEASAHFNPRPHICSLILVPGEKIHHLLSGPCQGSRKARNSLPGFWSWSAVSTGVRSSQGVRAVQTCLLVNSKRAKEQGIRGRQLLEVVWDTLGPCIGLWEVLREAQTCRGRRTEQLLGLFYCWGRDLSLAWGAVFIMVALTLPLSPAVPWCHAGSLRGQTPADTERKSPLVLIW